MDDSFSNISREINEAVERVLSSGAVHELKDTINTAMNQANNGIRQTMDDVRRQTQQTMNDVKRQGYQTRDHFRQAYQNFDPSEFHSNYTRTHNRMRQAHPYQEEQRAGNAAWQKPPTQPAVRYREPKGTANIVLGVIGCTFTGAAFLGMVLNLILNFNPAGILAAVMFFLLLAGSVSLIARGGVQKGRFERFTRYRALIHGRTYCEISELAAATGKTAKEIVKDLKKMIRLRLFPVGYLDDKETCLILDQETYHQYLETQEHIKQMQEEEKRRREMEEKDPQAARLQELLDEGKHYIQKIKEINVALPEEEISQKLDELEKITSKIFSYVEQHPAKVTQIRKFMCYYLPTTLKLVEAYRDLEEHGIRSEEVINTENEIKQALGNINLAFGNLLKDLMQDDLMDLSAEISTLEAMLAQEGLTSGLDFDRSLL